MDEKKQKDDEKLNKILKLFFNKYHKEEGYNQLNDYLDKEKEQIECVKNILKKISNYPFNQYLTRDVNSFKIYFFLFKKLKSPNISIGENIFFDIINSIFKIDSLELNKINIIIEIIKGENFFMLQHFDKILDEIIIKLLLEESSNKIKEGYYLDQIIKEGIESLYYNNKETSDLLTKKYDEMYKYLIKKLGNSNNQQIKLLVISWFNCLENFPGKDLSEHYYEIITKILNIMHPDNQKELDLGELYLKKIINDIIFSYDKRELNYIKKIIEAIINNNYSETNNYYFKKILFELLNKFLEKFEEILNLLQNQQNLLITDSILMKKIPFDLFPQILKFIIETLINLYKNSKATDVNEIKNGKTIIKSNTIFSRIMKKVKAKYFIFEKNNDDKKPFDDIFNIELFNNLDEKSTNLVFDWITQLYTSKLYKKDEFLQNLINAITNLKEFHIKRIIEVMYMIKDNSKEFDKQKFIKKILEKFYDLEFSERYGFFVLNELSDDTKKTMGLVDVFKEIANNFDSNTDIDFVSNIISLLTNYLIKEEKAKEVIEALNKDQKFFKTLYKVFCFNPFDTLAFLLLSKHFELSYFFVLYLSRMELESSDLIELNKAVHVFESHYFIDVRIQLLNPKSNIYLLKTLYAISLILPPGKALDTLSYRLKCLEMLYDFDEEDKEIKFDEHFTKDINEDDSSIAISENNEINRTSKDIEEKEDKYFKDYIQYMDENDKLIFELQNLEKYINIFETQMKKLKNFKRKNRTFKIQNK